jgi:thiamine monophosphate synthase
MKNKFRKLSKICQTEVIALGGISNSNLNKLSLLNIAGVAGITYFKKKAPY